MLTNKIIFERVMALLKTIDPKVPLHAALEPYLWRYMEEEALCKKKRKLEEQGRVPGKAYFIVKGFVLVYYHDEAGNLLMFRIYRERTIIILDCFMRQIVSPFTLEACKGTVLWSISSVHMDRIYRDMDGMKDLVWKTAANYNNAKEQLRNNFLVQPMVKRVWGFYISFKGLLPAGKVIADSLIAKYLLLSEKTLRRARRRLIEERVL